MFTVLGFGAALIGLLASLVTFSQAQRGARNAQTAVDELLAPESEPTIESRIVRLQRNLAASNELIGEINAEFELQAAAAERIKAEAEENQRLAALHKGDAEAVRKVVERTIEGAQSKASKVGRRQQWLFFLAGLLAAIPLGWSATSPSSWSRPGFRPEVAVDSRQLPEVAGWPSVAAASSGRAMSRA